MASAGLLTSALTVQNIPPSIMVAMTASVADHALATISAPATNVQCTSSIAMSGPTLSAADNASATISLLAPNVKRTATTMLSGPTTSAANIASATILIPSPSAECISPVTVSGPITCAADTALLAPNNNCSTNGPDAMDNIQIDKMVPSKTVQLAHWFEQAAYGTTVIVAATPQGTLDMLTCLSSVVATNGAELLPQEFELTLVNDMSLISGPVNVGSAILHLAMSSNLFQTSTSLLAPLSLTDHKPLTPHRSWIPLYPG
ncbi:hypothetical protein CVT25_006940 [Psilocybe cyanescens]|uniref:Uncharacterized protein n=1 Tax=Psilocybe cyanescens TaxID=93625 RepID=A0A409WYD9_PSICY|nr:hypothetical protein CVT25_006940 [Psilocybe cyanescens]